MTVLFCFFFTLELLTNPTFIKICQGLKPPKKLIVIIDFYCELACFVSGPIQLVSQLFSFLQISFLYLTFLLFIVHLKAWILIWGWSITSYIEGDGNKLHMENRDALFGILTPRKKDVHGLYD